MWAGLADVLNEIKPELPKILVRTEQPQTADYRWDDVLDKFDQVHEVSVARYDGGWSPGGIYSVLRRGFPQARKVESQLKNIDFEPNSTAFVFSGISLNQSLFLRRVQSENLVNSVLITLMKPNLTLDDFIFRYADSLFQNIYLNYFGTAFVDVHWLRVQEGAKTRTRDLRFRNRPADLVFTGVLPYRTSTLKSGNIYCPLYQTDRPRELEEQTVVVIGAAFHYEPYLDADRCVARFNELLSVIRRKHPSSRIIYKPHPGELPEQASNLDLTGVEVNSSSSVEKLVMDDRTISVAYAFNSISIYTAACLGIRAHFLYPLFDDTCVPSVIRTSYDVYLKPKTHPEMLIMSVDDWVDGKNDYKPTDVSEKIRSSTIRMLESAGVLTSNERMELIGIEDSPAIPEQRWQLMPEIRTLKGLVWRAMTTLIAYAFWKFPLSRLRKLSR